MTIVSARMLANPGETVQGSAGLASYRWTSTPRPA
jgi:hypothetical protein